jgi:hypothetical protein
MDEYDFLAEQFEQNRNHLRAVAPQRVRRADPRGGGPQTLITGRVLVSRLKIIDNR